MILTEKQNFKGETTETWRGKFLISNLKAGKQIFSADLPSALARQCFGGVVTGGVSSENSPFERKL